MWTAVLPFRLNVCSTRMEPLVPVFGDALTTIPFWRPSPSFAFKTKPSAARAWLATSSSTAAMSIRPRDGISLLSNVGQLVSLSASAHCCAAPTLLPAALVVESRRVVHARGGRLPDHLNGAILEGTSTGG